MFEHREFLSRLRPNGFEYDPFVRVTPIGRGGTPRVVLTRRGLAEESAAGCRTDPLPRPTAQARA